jgi:hypothetical protein
MICRRLIATVLAGALTLAGCTSMKTIRPASPGEPPFGPVQAGDTIVVRTREGVSARFVVQKIDGEALIAADGRRYARADLLRVQRKTFSGWKTTVLIAGVGAGALIVGVGLWLGANSR